MAQAARLTVRVDGSPSGIRGAIEAFDRFLAGQGIEPREAWRVQVALDEVLSNIVGHGYRHREGASVELTFVLEGGAIEVTIADDAPAHNPLSRPSPGTAGPLEARPAGGLGVHLVRSLMDGVEYARRDDRNWLVLRCRLSGAGDSQGLKRSPHGDPAGEA
jgi:serine/threonine-protein kinase RsbW